MGPGHPLFFFEHLLPMEGGAGTLLPMKVVQESGSAQMLLLITDTSQSNSLLWGGRMRGERVDSGERG